MWPKCEYLKIAMIAPSASIVYHFWYFFCWTLGASRTHVRRRLWSFSNGWMSHLPSVEFLIVWASQNVFDILDKKNLSHKLYVWRTLQVRMFVIHKLLAFKYTLKNPNQSNIDYHCQELVLVGKLQSNVMVLPIRS